MRAQLLQHLKLCQFLIIADIIHNNKTQIVWTLFSPLQATERYQEPVAFGSINIYNNTEIHLRFLRY